MIRCISISCYRAAGLQARWSFYTHDKLMEQAWLQIRKCSGFCFLCMTLLFLTFTLFRFSGFLSFFLCFFFFVSLLFSGFDVCLRHTHESTQDGEGSWRGNTDVRLKKSVGHGLCCTWHMFRRTGRQHAGGGAHDPQLGLLTGRDCGDTRCVLSKSWHCPRSFKSPVHLHQPSHPSPPLTPSSLSHYPRLPPACDIYL